MARPTTWRRSWNLTTGLYDGVSVMDLLVIQPGETLGGTWWTYRATSGPWAATSYLPQSSTTFMGLILRDDAAPTPDPRADSGADWLWWETVNWDVTSSASTEIYWLYYAWGPRAERKAEGMRKNDTAGNLLLSVITANDPQDGDASFITNTKFTCSASAVVILPA